MTGNVCSFVVMHVTFIAIWWMKKTELIVPTNRRQPKHVISERVHPVVFFRR